MASNANFSFEFIEGESLLLRLDLAGISVSSGSACSSGSLEPSYVLLATGRAIELAHGSLRFSFGKNNTKQEIDYCVQNLVKIVQDLREFIENADGVGKVGNASCGDIMEISLKIDNDIITDAKFRTFGCAAAIASSSVATQMVIGKTLDEALEIKNKDVVETLQGLPPQKIHCSVLAEEAIKKAVEDYRDKKNN